MKFSEEDWIFKKKDLIVSLVGKHQLPGPISSNLQFDVFNLLLLFLIVDNNNA